MKQPLALRPMLAAIAAPALLLASCGSEPVEKEKGLADLDKEIASETDPALTSALEDQITVDPALTQQSGTFAARPPVEPGGAAYPAPGPRRDPATGRTPGERAEIRSTNAVRAAAEGASSCAANVDINPRWASQLPEPFAIYPRGQLTEAAGNDAGGCRFRVVTFTASAPPQRVVDWYRGRVTRAGYSAEQQRRDGDLVLGGTRASDDGAYYLIVGGLQGGGSNVALIADNGS